MINRIYTFDAFPELNGRDVSIFIGSHRRMSEKEQTLIDRFCEIYNAVAYCDIGSGYHGKYGLSMFGAAPNTKMDLLIHIGEVSCTAYSCSPNEVWRVSEDGELRDTFRKLKNVFSMSETEFFSNYCDGKESKETSKFNSFFDAAQKKYGNLADVPFSNGWIASYLHDKLPHESVVHLGIVSTYFVWNKFRLDKSIEVVCNQGGFGIDGNLSTLIGASLVNPNKIYYCFLGDLAFFYDMNVLGNRHIGNNVRILIVNNGRGAIFRKPGNFASIFQEEADEFIAAGGHFAEQSETLVKDYAENLGFEYISAKTKEEFIAGANIFLSSSMTKRSIVYEVFVSVEDEILGDNIYVDNSTGLKGIAKKIFGKAYSSVLSGLKGQMKVDVGHN
jgi:2-succinyl-5-enolpyruvyl-6-hydroxy-3-cyclohexene-1-carboxylate synthase